MNIDGKEFNIDVPRLNHIFCHKCCVSIIRGDDGRFIAGCKHYPVGERDLFFEGKITVQKPKRKRRVKRKVKPKRKIDRAETYRTKRNGKTVRISRLTGKIVKR